MERYLQLALAAFFVFALSACGGGGGGDGGGRDDPDDPQPVTDFAEIAGTWTTPENMIQAQADATVDVSLLITADGYILINQSVPEDIQPEDTQLFVFGYLNLDQGLITGSTNFADMLVIPVGGEPVVERGLAQITANVVGTTAISGVIEYGTEQLNFYVEFAEPLVAPIDSSDLEDFAGPWNMPEFALPITGSDYAFNLNVTIDDFSISAAGGGILTSVSGQCPFDVSIAAFGEDVFPKRINLNISPDPNFALCGQIAGSYEGFAVAFTLPFGQNPADALNMTVGSAGEVIYLTGQDNLPP